MTSIIVVVIITISIISVIYLSYLLLSFSQPTKKKELQISLEDMLKQIEMLYRQKKYEIVEKDTDYLESFNIVTTDDNKTVENGILLIYNLGSLTQIIKKL